MMTVVAITAGLAPILWGGGTGADMMKRIAAPMVGGMVTATILTLGVIPAIYYLWRSRELGAAPAVGTARPPSGNTGTGG
jgi:Cu(I)/Ag(I) efflux system membrane protein CusA/SilA